LINYNRYQQKMTHQLITNIYENGNDGDEGTVKYYQSGLVMYPMDEV